MHAAQILIPLLLLASLSCTHTLAYPKVIPIERCDQIPNNRLFNKNFFSNGANKGELRIIRDVGNSDEYQEIAVTIDWDEFANIRVWESATAFLAPGKHTVKIWMSGAPLFRRELIETLELEVSLDRPTTVRIDLGHSNPPLRQTEQ